MVEIIPASPNDARGIKEVRYKTWLDTYPNEEHGVTRDDIDEKFKDSFTEEGIERMRSRIANATPNEKHLVARDNGRVVGAANFEKEESKNSVKSLYILPEYQNQGIGRRMWQEAEKFFDMSKDTTLWVTEYNMKARKFYEGLGFEDEGSRAYDKEEYKMKSGGYMPGMKMILRAKKKE